MDGTEYIIRYAMIRNGYKTVSEFAQKLGMKPYNVSRIISGKTASPSFEPFYAILTSLKIDPLYFYKKFLENKDLRLEFDKKQRSSNSYLIKRSSKEASPAYRYVKNTLWCEDIPFVSFCKLNDCTPRSIYYNSNRDIDEWPFRIVMSFCDLCKKDPKELLASLASPEIRKKYTPINEPDNE